MIFCFCCVNIWRTLHSSALDVTVIIIFHFVDFLQWLDVPKHQTYNPNLDSQLGRYSSMEHCKYRLVHSNKRKKYTNKQSWFCTSTLKQTKKHLQKKTVLLLGWRTWILDQLFHKLVDMKASEVGRMFVWIFSYLLRVSTSLLY